MLNLFVETVTIYVPERLLLRHFLVRPQRNDCLLVVSCAFAKFDITFSSKCFAATVAKGLGFESLGRVRGRMPSICSHLALDLALALVLTQ